MPLVEPGKPSTCGDETKDSREGMAWIGDWLLTTRICFVLSVRHKKWELKDQEETRKQPQMMRTWRRKASSSPCGKERKGAHSYSTKELAWFVTFALNSLGTTPVSDEWRTTWANIQPELELQKQTSQREKNSYISNRSDTNLFATQLVEGEFLPPVSHSQDVIMFISNQQKTRQSCRAMAYWCTYSYGIQKHQEEDIVPGWKGTNSAPKAAAI